MATTYVNFNPSPTENFIFQPMLDGNTYTAIITWNTFGQRYYMNLYDLSGVLVLCIAMIESPDNYNISLVAGYFDTQLVYRESTAQFEIIS